MTWTTTLPISVSRCIQDKTEHGEGGGWYGALVFMANWSGIIVAIYHGNLFIRNTDAKERPCILTGERDVLADPSM